MSQTDQKQAEAKGDGVIRNENRKLQNEKVLPTAGLELMTSGSQV